MKFYFLLWFSFSLLTTIAQKNEPYPSSDVIQINGLVTKQAIITVNDIAFMPDTVLSSLKILNHRGEYKTTYKNVKLVLLKRLLENNIISTIKPKENASLYFVCKAMDDYKVVYSYQEIFKPFGEGIYIMVAYDDYTISNMPEKPMLLNLSGAGSGNIGMRGLKSIEVKRAE